MCGLWAHGRAGAAARRSEPAGALSLIRQRPSHCPLFLPPTPTNSHPPGHRQGRGRLLPEMCVGKVARERGQRRGRGRTRSASASEHCASAAAAPLLAQPPPSITSFSFLSRRRRRGRQEGDQGPAGRVRSHPAGRGLPPLRAQEVWRPGRARPLPEILPVKHGEKKREGWGLWLFGFLLQHGACGRAFPCSTPALPSRHRSPPTPLYCHGGLSPSHALCPPKRMGGVQACSSRTTAAAAESTAGWPRFLNRVSTAGVRAPRARTACQQRKDRSSGKPAREEAWVMWRASAAKAKLSKVSGPWRGGLPGGGIRFFVVYLTRRGRGSDATRGEVHGGRRALPIPRPIDKMN